VPPAGEASSPDAHPPSPRGLAGRETWHGSWKPLACACPLPQPPRPRPEPRAPRRPTASQASRVSGPFMPMAALTAALTSAILSSMDLGSVRGPPGPPSAATALDDGDAMDAGPFWRCFRGEYTLPPSLAPTLPCPRPPAAAGVPGTCRHCGEAAGAEARGWANPWGRDGRFPRPRAWLPPPWAWRLASLLASLPGSGHLISEVRILVLARREALSLLQGCHAQGSRPSDGPGRQAANTHRPPPAQEHQRGSSSAGASSLSLRA